MRPRSPLTLLATTLLAPLALAQTKIPRPLPHMEDVKTPAVATPASPASAIATNELERAAQPTRRMPPKLQDGTSALPATSPIDRTRLHHDVAADGTLWTRGASWKMSFDASGATFIPYLGARAPRNFPLELRLASASVGGAPVAIEAAERAVRDGDRVVIDHGAIDEVWNLAPESAEQTFVLAARPGAGDLALRVAFATDLAPRADADGFAFENELGGVRYGRAFAVDARGARRELATRLESGAIAIDVPASVLADAAYPLVVDPFVSAFVVDDSPSYDDYVPDIAYLATTNRYCVVMEEPFSAADHDVYWYVLEADGSIASFLGTYADSSSDSWFEPRVAANALGSTFCVAGQVLAFGANQTEIRVRTRASNSMTMSAPLVVSSGFGGKLAADVGGDPALVGPTYFLVVWQRHYDALDSDVHARLVTQNGALVGTSTILIDNTSASLDYAPNVSKTDGNPPFSSQRWNVAWTRYNPGSDERDVRAAQLTWDGIVATPSFLVQSTGDTDSAVASPPLDGGTGPRPWAVAFRYEWGTYDHDINVNVLQGASVIAYDSLTSLEAAGTSLEDQTHPDIDTDGRQFVVAYAESYNGNLSDYDVYAASLWFVDGRLGLSEGHHNLDFSSASSIDPQIAAIGTAGTPGGRVAGTWTRRFTGGTGDIHGALYDTPVSIAPTSYCAGDGSSGACPCGNWGAFGNGCASSVNSSGGNLFGGGDARVSNDSFVLYGSGLASAPCLYFQGTARLGGPVFGDGLRCVGGTVVRLGTKQSPGGSSQIPQAGDAPISVAGNVPGAGAIRVYQAWYRNAASFCTVSTFNLTNGLEVVWLP